MASLFATSTLWEKCIGYDDNFAASASASTYEVRAQKLAVIGTMEVWELGLVSKRKPTRGLCFGLKISVTAMKALIDAEWILNMRQRKTSKYTWKL